MRRRDFVRSLAAVGAAGALRVGQETTAMAKDRYGVGILGNCCTHGAGLAGAFRGHARTQVAAGCEPDPRRGPELAQAMGLDLSASYQAVVEHPEVDILCLTTDPCDKADMVELACAARKPVFLNKPMCESLRSARRIEKATRQSGVPCVLDIPMVKGLAPFAKLRQEVASGEHGRPIAYHHDFGMTFPLDFPIGDHWPERFDPPETSGGGEMTNMGCYAIDYMVTLLGMPGTVQAKRASFWQEYADSPAENFGQIVCDYGDFFATLAVGKQKLPDPHGGVNDLSIRFANRNVLLNPYTDTAVINGVTVGMAEYVSGCQPRSSLDQLIGAIEEGTPPDDTVELGRMGVEVLMAAYRSIVEGGEVVRLPLKGGANPLAVQRRAPLPGEPQEWGRLLPK
jgi:predicted dehydrogenase